MKLSTVKLLLPLIFIAVLIPSAVPAQERKQAPVIKNTAEIMTQPMNVFRRFSGDTRPIYDFYGKILGLKQLTTYNISENTNVARFEIGTSQVKFSELVPNRKYQKGAVQDATGLRLLTFFFPSQAQLEERFRAEKLAVPEFSPVSGTRHSSALVQDPAGLWVELIIAPGEPASFYERVEIGLVVSDLEASRKFYRDFIGLEELPPVDDPVFHVKKYSFRREAIVVSLRSFGKTLPADTGSGGIQYQASNVESVQNLAKASQVKIDQPVSTLSGFGLRFVWLEDQDGITNYFAEVPATPAKKQ